MKPSTLKTFLLLILLSLAGEIFAREADFPGVLDHMYSQLTSSIYQKYISNGYRSLVFLPVVSRGKLETTVSYNCNTVMINRLKRKVQSATDPLLKEVEIKEGRYTNHEGKQTAFLEIELGDIKIKEHSFQLTVQLKEVSNTGDTIIENLPISGFDENIRTYVTPKPKMSAIVWIFIVLTGFVILLKIFHVYFWKQKINSWGHLIRPENYPFWRLAMISLLMISLFSVTLFYIQRKAIEGHAYFEGAEVHFFIDRNTGLFFDAGENNFVKLMQGILKETCNRISFKIHHPDTRALEKQGDLLTRLINWGLEKLGWESYRLKKFADLKKSEYSYHIYTFSEEDIDLKQSGNLAELVTDYDAIMAHVLKEMGTQIRQSSLIKPLGVLYNKLTSSKQDTKPKKKFIIIFSDAAESFVEDVNAFLENVQRFYSNKDQYLRVFSVLFPNIPRTSSDRYIYPYEEGKILLLSKISEFIVYMNDIASYTPGKLQEVNELFYKMLKDEIRKNPSTEAHYDQRLSRYKKLTTFMPGEKLLSNHQISRQNFLKSYVEPDFSKKSNQHKGASLYSDFFLYTYVSGLYKIENLDYQHREDWANPGDFAEARRELFGQPLDPGKMKKAINDIADTFVNQFIIIDKEPDKESLISKISISITIFAIIFSFLYAWLLYRYKYDVNYRIEKKDHVINITAIGIMLIIFIITLVYFRYENRWIIYGSWVWAFFVALIFLFSYYYLPLIFRLYLPKILPWLSQSTRKILKRESAKKNHLHYDMHDPTFSFDEMAWIKWLDRIFFNILIAPLLAFSLFLQILSPVCKQGIRKIKSPFISLMDFLFKDSLDLSSYIKVIEYFLILWMIVVIIYFLRAFIYSKTARVFK